MIGGPHLCGCYCTCKTVYGPRKPNAAEARAKNLADIQAWLLTPEGQTALAEIRGDWLIERGKRELGQALQEIFE